MRAWVGVLVAAVFLAVMFYVTRSETTVECSVCIRFNGIENCATVSGPDQAQAMMQATSTACAPARVTLVQAWFVLAESGAQHLHRSEPNGDS